MLYHAKEAVSRDAFGLIINTRPETIVWDFGSKGLMISRDNGKTFNDFSKGLSVENIYGRYERVSGKSPVVVADYKGNTVIYMACKDGAYQRDMGRF